MNDYSYLKISRSKHYYIRFSQSALTPANLGDTGGCKSSIYYFIRTSERVILELDAFSRISIYPSNLELKQFEGASIDNTFFCKQNDFFLI